MEQAETCGGQSLSTTVDNLFEAVINLTSDQENDFPLAVCKRKFGPF